MRNHHLLWMRCPEPIRFAFRLGCVRLCNLGLRAKRAYLGLHVRYLAFRCSRLLKVQPPVSSLKKSWRCSVFL